MTHLTQTNMTEQEPEGALPTLRLLTRPYLIVLVARVTPSLSSKATSLRSRSPQVSHHSVRSSGSTGKRKVCTMQSPEPRRQRAPAMQSVYSVTLDVLVVSATDLMNVQARAELLQRLSLLAHVAKTAEDSRRSTWLLLMTHTRQEGMLAFTLTGALTTANSWCSGVRVVKEHRPEETAHAAIDLHRLHYPTVPDVERAAHILVIGSAREREIFRATPLSPARNIAMGQFTNLNHLSTAILDYRPPS